MIKDRYSGYVTAIIESKSFGRSDTYANMLKYLVSCTLADTIPKESTIANDVLGKENFDPSESTLIRVYIYNLRKKLAKYYENEGQEAKVILKIPKGSYEVVFVPKNEKKKTIQLPFKTTVLSCLFLTIVLIILYVIQRNYTETTPLLWKNLLESERTKMLVLGDLFIYNEIDSAKGKIVTIRNANINSVEEFEEKIVPQAEEGIYLEPISYTFLIGNSSNWVKDLSKTFYKADRNYVIRTMSRFNPKELSDNDFMVVGMLKTLGFFTEYLNKEGYFIGDNILTYIDKNGNTFNYTPKGNADVYHTDYAVLLKVPGPNNNSIYFFGGIWDTGASQSLKYLTDVTLAKSLEKEMVEAFGELPDYYNILFEVSGVDRMQLQSKIIHLKRIDKK